MRLVTAMFFDSSIKPNPRKEVSLDTNGFSTELPCVKTQGLNVMVLSVCVGWPIRGYR